MLKYKAYFLPTVDTEVGSVVFLFYSYIAFFISFVSHVLVSPPPPLPHVRDVSHHQAKLLKESH